MAVFSVFLSFIANISPHLQSKYLSGAKIVSLTSLRVTARENTESFQTQIEGIWALGDFYEKKIFEGLAVPKHLLNHIHWFLVQWPMKHYPLSLSVLLLLNSGLHQ